MGDTKVLTLRLPVDMWEALEIVARADEVTMTDAIREAIAAHIERRRQDSEFQQRLRDRLESDKRILDSLRPTVEPGEDRHGE